MQSSELSGARLVGYGAAAFFAVLALYLTVTGIWVALFFRDSGIWDPSFLRVGLILLLYAALFAAAARLVVARVPSRRWWLLLAVVALPGIPLATAGGLLPRPWTYAVVLGLLLILLFAAKQIRLGPR